MLKQYFRDCYLSENANSCWHKVLLTLLEFQFPSNKPESPVFLGDRQPSISTGFMDLFLSASLHSKPCDQSNSINKVTLSDLASGIALKLIKRNLDRLFETFVLLQQ